MTARTIAILLVVLCIAPQALSVNPGIRTTLTQKGLTYAKDVGIGVLREKVKTIYVPTTSGSTHAPVIGDVDYTISDIYIRDLTFPKTVAKIIPNSNVELQVSDAGASMTLNWSYREHHWPHIKGHGSADVTAKDVTITLHISFSETGGRPIVAGFTASVAIGSLDVKVHGGPSWLYNLLIKLFKDKIKDDAEKAITSSIEKQKPLLDGVLAKLPRSFVIDKEAEIDWGLSSAPEIASNYLSLPISASWIALEPKKMTAPVVATPIPSLTTAKMFEITAAPSIIDGASWVFWYEGKMKYTIVPKDVPPSSPVKLNTTNFRGYVPLMYQKYPNKGLELKISADKAPVATVNASGITVKGSIDVEAIVILNETSTTPAFTLTIDIVATATVKLTETIVSLNLTYFSSTTTLKKSYIGTFDPTTLETVIKFLMDGVLFPYANSYANKGFPLPVIKGVKLIDPAIGYGKDYIFISSDISYTP